MPLVEYEGTDGLIKKKWRYDRPAELFTSLLPDEQVKRQRSNHRIRPHPLRKLIRDLNSRANHARKKRHKLSCDMAKPVGRYLSVSEVNAWGDAEQYLRVMAEALEALVPAPPLPKTR